MNISTLEQYVERKNSWGKLFGSKPLSLLNAKDRQTIANSIDSDMSPENLTCDGELSRSQVSQRIKFLSRCAEELLSIDPSVTFYEMGV
jgi:predicted DNA-binding protein YlxM (UPF0122 family)